MFKKLFSREKKMLKNISKSIEMSPILDAKTEGEWREEFNRIADSLNKISLSESEKLDKGLLTMSSIFLGFTMTITNNIVPLNQAINKEWLYMSWLSFWLSIVVIFIGLFVNMKSNTKIVEGAEKFLINHDLRFSNYGNDGCLGKIANFCNILAILLFIAGSGIFISFVLINLQRIYP